MALSRVSFSDSRDFLEKLPTALFLYICQFLTLSEKSMLPVLSRVHFDPSRRNYEMWNDALKQQEQKTPKELIFPLGTGLLRMDAWTRSRKWIVHEMCLGIAWQQNKRNEEVKFVSKKQRLLVECAQENGFPEVLDRLWMQRIILTVQRRKRERLALMNLASESDVVLPPSSLNNSLEISNQNNKHAIGIRIGCLAITMASGGIAYAVTSSLFLSVCCAGVVGILLLAALMIYSRCKHRIGLFESSAGRSRMVDDGVVSGSPRLSLSSAA